ncbi:60S acidic ribosomal protein [Raphidocelis subcapitata]|uniref:60S acidic ribosomal protein n=1 Tax=Raphidocelis subcapitata TaxID=307507 RepID=A0A2V0PQA9_9CHLO|nr:60S acidic ribosomal protein [Raphidocelis subcapitata]|eukprot:GBG00251.1 60S acidic ribosomal protein [Raphidocelis subcapitata]
MRVVSAVLLAVLGGNANPTAADVKKILGSVGVEADAANVEKLLGELAGKDIAELIAAGREKLQSVPSGGGAVAAAPAAGGAAPAAGKAEAKKEEPSEEDEDMGFSLFD